MTPLEKILPLLDKVRCKGSGRHMACCPAHDDRTPSLHITEKADGDIIFHCFAGCDPNDVLAAIGLTWTDVFQDTGENYPPLKPGERWIPRDVIKTLRNHILLVIVYIENIQNGEEMTEYDKDELMKTYHRFCAAAREVGFED